MRVISYCVFGPMQSGYWQTMPLVLRANHHLYPGWEIRVHHPSGSCPELWKRYESQGLLTLVDSGPMKTMGESLLWRLKPIWDGRVDCVLCRDLDSYPMVRERQMVEQFLETGCAAHNMADHPYHTVVYMAGLCDWRPARFREYFSDATWEQMLKRDGSKHNINTRDYDQFFMQQVIWPVLQHVTCQHLLRGGSGLPTTSPHVYRTIPNYALPDVLPAIKNENDQFSEHAGAIVWPLLGTEKGQKIKAFFDQHGTPELMERFRKAEET